MKASCFSRFLANVQNFLIARTGKTTTIFSSMTERKKYVRHRHEITFLKTEENIEYQVTLFVLR